MRATPEKGPNPYIPNFSGRLEIRERAIAAQIQKAREALNPIPNTPNQPAQEGLVVIPRKRGSLRVLPVAAVLGMLSVAGSPAQAQESSLGQSLNSSTTMQVEENTALVPEVNEIEVVSVEEEPAAEAAAEAESPASIDILSFPGWTGFRSVSRQEDGTMVITSSGTELRVSNINNFIEIGPNGFEVMTKIRTVASPLRDLPGPIPVTGSIVFYNKSLNQNDVLRLEIGLNNRNYLRIAFVDMTQENSNNRVKLLAAPTQGVPIIQSSTDELQIKFVGSGDTERFSIYDGEGTALMKNVKLPRPFFSEDSNQLFFGFYPVSGSNAQLAIMTVDYLQAQSL